MSGMGFRSSPLGEAMDLATKTVELKERLVHAAAQTLVAIKLDVGSNETLNQTTYYIRRGKLLELVTEEEKWVVERAHRLMHGVTGD